MKNGGNKSASSAHKPNRAMQMQMLNKMDTM